MALNDSFKGTKYERLASKIKEDVRKKKRHTTNSSEGSEPRVSGNKRKLSGVKEDEVKPLKATTRIKSSSNSVTTHYEDNEFNNKRTVYIQGLPFSATEEDVRLFFEQSGKVKEIRLPKWQDSGKIRGYGHVEFDTEVAADNALDRSGEYMNDRYIIIERPQNPRSYTSEAKAVKEKIPGCRKIFVKNIPYDITEEELRQAFMVYGQILNVRFAVWSHTNNKKGFAYIDFKREDSAEIAVKKSGSVVIRSRKIVVDYDTGAPKGGFKDHAKREKK